MARIATQVSSVYLVIHLINATASVITTLTVSRMPARIMVSVLYSPSAALLRYGAVQMLSVLISFAYGIGSEKASEHFIAISNSKLPITTSSNVRLFSQETVGHFRSRLDSGTCSLMPDPVNRKPTSKELFLCFSVTQSPHRQLNATGIELLTRPDSHSSTQSPRQWLVILQV